ncbi:MAG: hypothetical protein GC156_03885 [Actinomycetales bacterium]|nr:hypothetical protein [Actinomycetales bacterium]
MHDARAKVRAAETGASVGSVIEEALRAHLLRSVATGAASLAALPTISTGGTRPGIDLDDMSAVYEVLDEGRPVDALR